MHMELAQAMDLIRHPGMTRSAPARWADLGCGSGLFTYALANLLPDGSHLYAIDQSPVALDPLPKPAQTKVEFRQVDFVNQALPPIRPGRNPDGQFPALRARQTRATEETASLSAASGLLCHRGVRYGLG